MNIENGGSMTRNTSTCSTLSTSRISGSFHSQCSQRRRERVGAVKRAAPSFALMSRIARVLNAYDVNLHTAMINTLGSRAEDTFLITGEALNDPKTVVRFESELLEQLRT